MPAVTQTTAAPFIPELWGNIALGKVAGTLVLGNLVNRNFANFPAQVGDIVNVPVRGAITSALKASGAALAYQAPADSTIQVQINKHRVAPFQVPTDVDALANTDVMEGYLTDAAVAIAEDVEIDGLTAAYTGFTTNSVGAAGAALTEANVLSAREKLVLAKVPQAAPKYLFLYPTAVTTALGIARLSEADKLGIPEGPIRDGAIGKLHGFTVIESQYVVVTAGAPNDTHNVAFAPDAMTLALRPFKAPRSPGVISRISEGSAEAGTGNLGLRIWMAFDASVGADVANAEVLYGWKAMREAFGVHYHT